MKIERTLTYDVAPEVVYEMTCLQAFQEQKCADAGALKWTVTVVDDGEGVVVRTRRTLPTDTFPSMLRKLTPGGIVSTETLHWAPEGEPDGSRTATLHFDFHGAPLGMNGSVVLSPDGGGGCVATISADFHASVPLVGGKVEKLAAPIIIGVIDSEQLTGRAWVADAA